MKHSKKIDSYIELLKEYNEDVNVFSRKSYETLPFHIEDCQNLASLIPDTANVIFDLGSGSGLPSVILAILLRNVTVYALESKGKKCAFLDLVKADLDLKNYLVVNTNVFEFPTRVVSPDVITAKAFGPLEKTLRVAERFAKKGTQLIVPISQKQRDAYLIEYGVKVHFMEKNGFLYLTKTF